MFRRVSMFLPALLAATLSAVACSRAAGPTGSPSNPSATGGNVTVSVQQWSVTPSTPTVPTGLVSFAVTDKGTIKHEFVVLRTDTPASEIPIESFEGEKDRINEDAAGTNVGETGDMRPGATKTITIDLKPGHYVLFCNLPGHYGMGMHTDFTVT